MQADFSIIDIILQGYISTFSTGRNIPIVKEHGKSIMKRVKCWIACHFIENHQEFSIFKMKTSNSALACKPKWKQTMQSG